MKKYSQTKSDDNVFSSLFQVLRFYREKQTKKMVKQTKNMKKKHCVLSGIGRVKDKKVCKK